MRSTEIKIIRPELASLSQMSPGQVFGYMGDPKNICIMVNDKGEFISWNFWLQEITVNLDDKIHLPLDSRITIEIL